MVLGVLVVYDGVLSIVSYETGQFFSLSLGWTDVGTCVQAFT